jgi:anti-sigma factor RsiW
MRRSRLESLLHDYVAQDLDEEGRREVERHLAADPAARALHAEVKAAHEALSLLRDRPEPPVGARDVLPRIQAAIAAHAFEARPKLHLEGMGTRFYRRLAIAATMLFAVTAGYVALAPRGEAPPPAEARPPIDLPAAGVERVVELGSRREGITAEEFFRILDEMDDLRDLSVAPVVNVVPVGEER